MALTDYADTFFTDNSIVYADAEDNICKIVPSVMFEADKSVQYRQIAIPDNTLDNFFMYQFDPNEHVENLFNARLGRLWEPEDFTYTIGTTYTLVTNYTHTADEVLNIARHGDGIVFDTEDAARNVILEVSVVNKDPQYLDNEIRTAIKFLYYYLYNEDANGFYNYIQRLSILKKNRMKENVKTKEPRKVYHFTADPLVM